VHQISSKASGIFSWSEVDVVVGTAENFRRVLDSGLLRVDMFSLLVFDECHHATGNSAMTGVVSCVQRSERRPRLLGLTSTFAGGSAPPRSAYRRSKGCLLKPLASKMVDLENLLDATILSPQIYGEGSGFDYKRHEKMDRAIAHGVGTVIRHTVEDSLSDVDLCRVRCNAYRLTHDLGLDAFWFYLCGLTANLENENRQTYTSLGQNTRYRAPPTGRLPGPVDNYFPIRRADSCGPRYDRNCHRSKNLEQLVKMCLPNVKALSRKVMHLISVITDFLTKKVEDESQTERKFDFVGIVFVEHSYFTAPMRDILSVCFDGVAAVNELTNSKRREELLSHFNRGDIQLLVATNEVECVLEIPKCNFVIRFDKIHATPANDSVKKWGAEVYFFENDISRVEEQTRMYEVIERQVQSSKPLRAMVVNKCSKHPYFTPGGGQVDLYNCPQIMYEYVAKVVGSIAKPKELILRFKNNGPGCKSIEKVVYPSPDGYQEVTAEEVDEYWGDVNIDSITDKARTRNWKQLDKIKRRHIYVVVIQMKQKGYLGPNNEPTSAAKTLTRRKCPPVGIAKALKESSGLPSTTSTTEEETVTLTDSEDDSSGSGREGIIDNALSSSPRGSPSSIRPGAFDLTRNYKNKLQERVQAFLPNTDLSKDVVYRTYELQMHGKKHRFQSEVYIPGRQRFFGLVKHRKKFAEQSAAHSALCNMSVRKLAGRSWNFVSQLNA